MNISHAFIQYTVLEALIECIIDERFYSPYRPSLKTKGIQYDSFIHDACICTLVESMG